MFPIARSGEWQDIHQPEAVRSPFEETLYYVREPGKKTNTLSGFLLVAHPNLRDPNFRRSIIVIANQDDEEGALGMIVNRPLDKTVGEFFPGKELASLSDVPVLAGGPVGRDQLTFAAFTETDEGLQVRTHLPLPEAMSLADDPVVVMRAFLGYSGWGKLQLEAEVAQKAWIIQQATSAILDVEATLGLWRETMRGLGPWFELLAEAPDDPSLN